MYYSLATVWPDMVDVLYADPSSPLSASWLATLLTLGLVVGEVAGSFIGKPLGYLKWQCLITFLIGGIFFGCEFASAPISISLQSIHLPVCPRAYHPLANRICITSQASRHVDQMIALESLYVPSRPPASPPNVFTRPLRQVN